MTPDAGTGQGHNGRVLSRHPVSRVALVVIAAACAAGSLGGCGSRSGGGESAPPFTGSPDKRPSATPSTRAERVALEVVGMSEAAARARAERAGLTSRVVQRDGEQFPVTMDYSTRRLNLVIESGTVTAATVG